MNAAEYCEFCKHKRGYSNECKLCTVDLYSDMKPTMFAEWTPLKETQEKEAVNHPDHYKAGTFECIDVMIELFGIDAVKNFCLLNAFKYLWRCDHKENRSKDVEKAGWYISKFADLELMKKK